MNMTASVLATAAVLAIWGSAIAQEDGVSAAAAPASDLCLTNACSEGPSFEAAKLRNPALAAAVRTGDINRVMELGGSAEDVIDAMRSRLAADPDALLDPRSERPVRLDLWLSSTDRHLADGDRPIFFQDNGHTRMGGFAPDGRLIWATVVPGMNAPGRAPVGTPYHLEAPEAPPPRPPPPAP